MNFLWNNSAQRTWSSQMLFFFALLFLVCVGFRSHSWLFFFLGFECFNLGIKPQSHTQTHKEISMQYVTWPEPFVAYQIYVFHVRTYNLTKVVWKMDAREWDWWCWCVCGQQPQPAYRIKRGELYFVIKLTNIQHVPQIQLHSLTAWRLSNTLCMLFSFFAWFVFGFMFSVGPIPRCLSLYLDWSTPFCNN